MNRDSAVWGGRRADGPQPGERSELQCPHPQRTRLVKLLGHSLQARPYATQIRRPTNFWPVQRVLPNPPRAVPGLLSTPSGLRLRPHGSSVPSHPFQAGLPRTRPPEGAGPRPWELELQVAVCKSALWQEETVPPKEGNTSPGRSGEALSHDPEGTRLSLLSTLPTPSPTFFCSQVLAQSWGDTTQ